MLGFVSWVGYLGFFVTAAALVCKYISPQAIGIKKKFFNFQKNLKVLEFPK